MKQLLLFLSLAVFLVPNSIEAQSCSPDITPPHAICQDITVYLGAGGTYTLTAVEINASSFDSCSAVTLSIPATIFSCVDLGSNLVTMTVTDAALNSTTCTSTVTVVDTFPPTAICKNITVNLDATGNAAIVATDVDNGSNDGCGGALTYSVSPSIFNCANIGTNIVWLVVTDPSGNVDSCMSTVTIADTVPPTAICMAGVAYLNASGSVTVDSSYIDNGSFDVCSSVTMSVFPSVFSCDSVGTRDIWLVVTDSSGNSDTCQTTIDIQDTVSPTAICKNAFVYLDATGSVTIDSSYINNGSSDNCTPVTMTLSQSTFTCADFGLNMVTLTVMDTNGNSGTCMANVFVQDSIPPMAICKDTTIYLGALGTVTIDSSFVDNGSTDNCGDSTMALSKSSFDCSNVGPNIVELYVTDLGGNIDTCMSTVTVLDTIPPTASCKDITIYLDSMGTVTIDSSDIDNGSSDNCGLVTMTISSTTFTCDSIGARTVSLIVTDPSGVSDTCTSTVTVVDNIAPVAMCADTTVYLDANGGIRIDSSFIDSASWDNCNLVSMTIDKDTFSCADAGANTVTLTVMDSTGNVSVCSSIVTVLDTITPIAVCKDTTVYLDAAGKIQIDTSYTNNGSSDNCDFVLTLSRDTFNCADIGVNAVEMYATDASGNVDTCTTNVTVLDTIKPLVVCQNITIYLDSTGNDTLSPAELLLVSFDACPTTDSISKPFYTCADIGVHMVTVYVTDASGNIDSCTSMVTLKDSIAPEAICKDSIIYLDANGGVRIDSNALDNGSWDNCHIGSITLDMDTFSCVDAGPVTVTMTVTDTTGNSSTCTSTVTVLDTISPVAHCYAEDTIYLDASGMFLMNASFIDSASYDNCLYKDSLSQSMFDCSDTGVHIITYYVTDSSGNMDSCMTTITVLDTIAPVAVCMNVTITLDSNGMVIIDSSHIDGGIAEACPYTVTLSKDTFDCSDIGPNLVRMVVTDASGNKDSCDAIVTIHDSVPPVARCFDTTIYLDASGYAMVQPKDVNDTTYDNCYSVNINTDTTEFDCSNIGPNNVMLIATDASGNKDTCTAIVTIADTFPPVAICKDTTIYLNAMGMMMIDSSFIDNGSYDFCGPITMTLSANAYDCDSVGVRMISLYVLDSSGNGDTCTAMVTVLDTTTPMAICTDTTIYVDQNGQFVIDSSFLIDTIIEACSYTAVLSETLFTCADIPNNTTTVSLYVEDASGNKDTCYSEVTVLDTLAPMAMCKNAHILLDSMGNAHLYTSDIENGSTDNCGIDTIYISEHDYTCADLGDNDVTLYVEDIYGNIDSCIATVTVLDLIAPSVTCMDDTIYLDANGMGSISVTDVLVSSFENCTDTMYLSDTLYTCSDIGLNTVTLTIRDESGRSGDCQSTITVMDTLNPVVNCNNFTISLNAIGEATISVDDVDNASTDNCGIASRTISQNSFTCTDTGVNMVTLTITDVNGNVDSCIAQVTVTDLVAPNVLCQNVTIYLDASGNASIDSSDIDNGSSDNCGIATMTLSQDTFECVHIGAVEVTLTVTDINGNSDSCKATVNVIDNIAPVAMCKDTTIYLDATGNVTIDSSFVDNGSSDNCSFTMVLSETTYNCVDTGANTVTLYVTDASGSLSICTSTVTVYDSLAPVMMCKMDTVYLDAAGLGTNMVSDIDNGTWDNCVIASMSLSNYNYSCADIGINNVTLTATDVSGNTNSCMTTVLVLDTVSPMAMCKDVTVYLDSMGMVSIDSSYVDNGSTDNCEIATIAISQSDFVCNEIGPNTITVTVTDVSGNSSTCTSIVTVLDTIVPEAMCKNVTVYLDSTNLVTVNTSDVLAGSWDNCNIDSVWLSQSMFTCMHLGPNNIGVFVADSSGNIDSCTAIVTVVLLNVPEIDTIAVQVDEFNFAQICLTDDRLLGSPSTYTSLKAVTYGNLINYNDTCFTYTQTSVVKFLDTASVIICDDCGICDTTVLIFVPKPSKETFVLGPVIPLAHEDTCVNLESTFMTGMHIGTCDGTGTSNGGVPLTITGLCVRYTVPGAVFTGDTSCIIVCDTIHGLVVCDSTCIVYLPDTTPPTVMCKNDTVYLSTLGTASIDTSNVLAGVYDNTLVNSVWVSPNMFNCANVGGNTVTVFARDTNRNMASCNATVTVLDTISPTAICQNITIRLDSNGTASIVAADVDGGSFDNCDLASIVINQSNFDCSHMGANSVTLTVKDIHGNSSTCTATVTVEDLVAPIVYCPGNKNRIVRNTTCSYIVEDFTGETNMWDNCSTDDLVITQSPDAGTELFLENEDTTITITIEDGSGNTSTCSFKVNVRCTKKLIVPQFLSPNGDGINDTWEIPELMKYPNNTVKVFNRWGNLVFEQKGYFTGWDGSANTEGTVTRLLDNKMLPEGTYFYIIDLGENSGFEPSTGYLQIKR